MKSLWPTVGFSKPHFPSSCGQLPFCLSLSLSYFLWVPSLFLWLWDLTFFCVSLQFSLSLWLGAMPPSLPLFSSNLLSRFGRGWHLSLFFYALLSLSRVTAPDVFFVNLTSQRRHSCVLTDDNPSDERVQKTVLSPAHSKSQKRSVYLLLWYIYHTKCLFQEHTHTPRCRLVWISSTNDPLIFMHTVAFGILQQFLSGLCEGPSWQACYRWILFTQKYATKF